MIDIILNALYCFTAAIFYPLLPMIIGFVLGWIMRGEKMDFYKYLEKLIVKLDEEGKLLPGEKETLLKSVKELKEEKENDL